MDELKTMSFDRTAACERVSALADGELHGLQCADLIAELQGSEELRRVWSEYHLVGEVLRKGSGAVVLGHDEAFIGTLRARMALENPPRVQAVPAPVASDAVRGFPQADSANDALWRWKMVAGLCTLAAVSVLGWHLAGLRAADPAAAQLAQLTPSATPSVRLGEKSVMIRDARLDQLIAAHQQQGGNSALQAPAGFVRNAAFERSAP